MAALALPLAMEPVRQALAEPTPPFKNVADQIVDLNFERVLRKHEAALAGVEKQARAFLANLRSRIDPVFVADTLGKIDDEDRTKYAEVMETFSKAIENAAANIISVEDARGRILGMFKPGVPMRGRTKRLLDRVGNAAIDYHNGLVGEYYRLKTIGSRIDPEASEAVVVTENAADIDRFFESVLAS